MKTAALSLTLLLAVTGCGKDDKNDSGGGGATLQRSAGMTVADEASLPACDEATAGALVYVEATKNFRSCASGTWTTIDLTGQAGAKGDPGAAGADGVSDIAKALTIYKASRKSVFRVEVTCTFLATPATGCPTGNGFLGTAFLCGDKQLCTNAHVVSCDTACFSGLESLKVEQTVGDTDSTNDGDAMVAPFFTAANDSTIRFHATKDLAMIPIPANPAGSTVLKLASASFTTTAPIMTPILSLSFALGFQDLYTDVGYVNTPDVTECDVEGGQSGYKCPGHFYDFSSTNDTDHGSSGSPLFNIVTGEVVGVTTAGTEDANANFTWATDASQYKDVP